MSISREVKAAIQVARDSALAPKSVEIIINAYIDAEAGRRMAEFWAEHGKSERDCRQQKYKPIPASFYSSGGVEILPCADPRHTWTLAEWRAEVLKELED